MLIGISANLADGLITALKDAGVSDVAQIGEMLDNSEEKIW